MKTTKNFAFAIIFGLLAMNTAQAASPKNSLSVNATNITLQGGSNSSVQWVAPAASTYNVWVKIPAGSTASNVVYRVYPQGNNLDCFKNVSLCPEVTVNQAANQGKTVLLTSGAFDAKGFVSLNVSNLSSTESVSIPVVKFENIGSTLQIGQSYQGGIIFHLDKLKLHGLVTALTNVKDASGNPLFINTTKANAVDLAKLCDYLEVNNNLKTYSHWRLPSRDELILIDVNIGLKAAELITNVAMEAYAYKDYSDIKSATFIISEEGLYTYIPKPKMLTTDSLVRCVLSF